MNVLITGASSGIGAALARRLAKDGHTVGLHGTGVSVKLIQPGPVDTEMWDQPDNDASLYQGAKVPPEEVAEGILTALSSDRFEHYLPDLKAIVDGKQADVDAFITGSARMAG